MTSCIHATQGVEPRRTVELPANRKLPHTEVTIFWGCVSWLSYCYEFYPPIRSDSSL